MGDASFRLTPKPSFLVSFQTLLPSCLIPDPSPLSHSRSFFLISFQTLLPCLIPDPSFLSHSRSFSLVSFQTLSLVSFQTLFLIPDPFPCLLVRGRNGLGMKLISRVWPSNNTYPVIALVNVTEKQLTLQPEFLIATIKYLVVLFEGRSLEVNYYSFIPPPRYQALKLAYLSQAPRVSSCSELKSVRLGMLRNYCLFIFSLR